MSIFRLSFRAVAITFATMALAGVAVFLAQPKPIDSAVLGAEWQCSRTAFVLTTCAQRAPAAESPNKVALRARQG